MLQRMCQIRYLLLVILLLVAFSLACQTVKFAESYLLSYPKTAIYTVKQPFQMSGEDWRKAGLIIFATGSLYLFDDEINDMVQRNKSHFTRNLALVGNQFGNGKMAFPLMGVVYAGGCIFHSNHTKDTALLCVKSIFLAGSGTTTLKMLTQRNRPFKDEGKEFWNSKGFSKFRDSFPSGHATLIWSIAPIIAEQYKDVKWVPPVAYSAAVLTAYARMHDEKHWSSDVFAGAMVGYFTSQIVLKTTPRLQVTPSLEQKGILINYNF
jgi:membrane-associated phospholipid phosphatase